MLVMSCGRIAFEPLSTTAGDAPPDDAQACTMFGPWSPPVRLASVSTIDDDWEPAQHPDGSRLVFARRFMGIFIADRSGTTVGAPVPVSTVSGNAEGPAWSPAGDQLYFTLDPSGTGASRLWVADYVGNVVQAPREVVELADEPLLAPAISVDGLELYYSTPFTNYRIRRATRASLSSPWVVQGEESQLQIAGEGGIGWPSISGDGLTLYYEYIENDQPQIYAATRASTAQRFENPTPVTLGNLFGADPDISHDGATLFFSGFADGSTTGYDLYVTTRTCL